MSPAPKPTLVTLFMALARLASAEGGAELPYLLCAPAQRPPRLAESDLERKRLALIEATKRFKQMGGPWAMFKGKNVLDVGMGQGPIGVAALEKGVKTYTGLDPALCIEKPAMTHDKSTKHMTDGASCYRPCVLATSSACTECKSKMSKKYRLFPYSGLDMMAAYNSAASPNRLVLLPGTFDSIRVQQAELQQQQLLRPGQYDVATLMTVTEHLPDSHLVLRGIYEWTRPGTKLYVDHHNYYSFRGHHRDPDRVSAIDDGNPFHRDHARWKHLEPTSLSYNDDNLNRMRLGDLVAAIDMYFTNCTYRASVPALARELLTCGAKAPRGSILAALKRRGFSREELLADHVHFTCYRRTTPATPSPDPRASWKLHHPPTDGSYTPAALPHALRKVLVEAANRQKARSLDCKKHQAAPGQAHASQSGPVGTSQTSKILSFLSSLG